MTMLQTKYEAVGHAACKAHARKQAWEVACQYGEFLRTDYET